MKIRTTVFCLAGLTAGVGLYAASEAGLHYSLLFPYKPAMSVFSQQDPAQASSWHETVDLPMWFDPNDPIGPNTRSITVTRPLNVRDTDANFVPDSNTLGDLDLFLLSDLKLSVNPQSFGDNEAGNLNPGTGGRGFANLEIAIFQGAQERARIGWSDQTFYSIGAVGNVDCINSDHDPLSLDVNFQTPLVFTGLSDAAAGPLTFEITWTGSLIRPPNGNPLNQLRSNFSWVNGFADAVSLTFSGRVLDLSNYP